MNVPSRSIADLSESYKGEGLGTTNALAIDGFSRIWATTSQNGVSALVQWQ